MKLEVDGHYVSKTDLKVFNAYIKDVSARLEVYDLKYILKLNNKTMQHIFDLDFREIAVIRDVLNRYYDEEKTKTTPI